MEPFQENSVSSSLRQRKPWVSVADQLLRSASTWTEADLNDHDITSTRISPQLGIIWSVRFILLSQSDSENPPTADRIEQLYLSGRGRNAAIIFLTEDNPESAMQAFMTLQTKMIESTLPNLPIILLTSPELLPTVLDTFLASTETSRTAPWPLNVPRDLLPHCTVNSLLTPEATTTLGLKSLLAELSTPAGQPNITSTIGEKGTEFWTQEFVLGM